MSSSGFALLAVISIGSNSVRLLVAQRQPGGHIRALERLEQVTRLAQYKSAIDGETLLGEDVVRDTLEAARRFARHAASQGSMLIGIVATEAVRAAANRAVLLGALERELAVPVTVVSGEEEAALGWRAVASNYAHQGEYLGVVDIGGASTDLSLGRSTSSRPDSVKSLKVGSRTLMRRFGLDSPTSPDRLWEVVVTLVGELDPPLQPKPDVIVVIGGTASVLKAVRGSEGEGEPIERTWLVKWLEEASAGDLSDRVALGVPADRADVIAAGGAILLAVLKMWDLEQFYVSQRNILDGFLEQAT
jgi:exopolyphosphatase/guanosine-5'-triphosphate,3'-diphosphate pyrophosphatase